jgi:selenocysteine lyase/cysteine desulfurase
VDLDHFRKEFPTLERVVWLNTATAAPPSRPVLEALRRAEREWEEGTFSWQAWERDGHATRPTFARLVGGQEDEVALVSSVSEAAATVAASLPGGRVVVGAREFRSNLFPWLALRERGFDVVEVPATDGVIRTEALAGAVDERTVLVAVSEVQSSNGFRVRLPDLAARCREVGARLFVDLAQSLGALRFDAPGSGVDFAACVGYKWLLAPRGVAWLWVRPDRIEELRPLVPSWQSVLDPHADYYDGPMELAPGASKLDTSPAWLMWVAARPALELLHRIDARGAEVRCLELARAFRDGAGEAGFSLVPEDAPSQIVGMTVDDPAEVRGRLKDLGVVAAVRGGFLRLGFHAFNDGSDVEAALKALGRPRP